MQPPDERHPDWYESVEVFAFATDLDVVVGVRLTEHPVRNIAEAACSIVVDGRQRSLHASMRRSVGDVVWRVGPLALDDEHGTVSAAAPELGLVVSMRGVVPSRDERLTAWVEGDVDVRLDGDVVVSHAGCRCLWRRTSGIWPTPPGTYGAPALELPQFFRWSAAIDGTSADDLTPTWQPGTRWCAGGSIELDDGRHDFETRARLPMRGLGYDDVEWPAGVWHDELAVGTQSWNLDDLDPTDVHNLRAMHAIELGDGRLGFLDLVAVGPHDASGLRGFTEGA